MGNQIEVILFDLGGVLIELTGMPRFLEWNRNSFTPEIVWEKWLNSDIVRSYETGRLGDLDFADGIINEFDLNVSRSQFIKEFTYWPSRLYPGVPNMLGELSER